MNAPSPLFRTSGAQHSCAHGEKRPKFPTMCNPAHAPRKPAGILASSRVTRGLQGVTFVTLAVLATGVWAAPLAAKDSLGCSPAGARFAIPRCALLCNRGARTVRRRARLPALCQHRHLPRQAIRGQLHIRLSHKVGPASAIRLVVGTQRFELSGGGGDAWAQGKAMDAAIVAAMRSAGKMTVSARSVSGRLFTDSYSLAGAATAMDAATIGCARLR